MPTGIYDLHECIPVGKKNDQAASCINSEFI